MRTVASNENVVNSLRVKYKSNRCVLLNGMCFSIVYEGPGGGIFGPFTPCDRKWLF